jgi:hypothetical protein
VALFVPLVLFAGCGGASPGEPPCRVRSDHTQACGPTRVSLEITGSGGLVVEGTIDGRHARLLVDTGASRTVISSTLLGVADQTGALSSVCVGDLCFPREPVWAWDTPFSDAAPDAINGFIGMSTLQYLLVGIDHADRVILDSVGTGCRGAASPITFTDPGGTPLVDVRAGTLPEATLALDSGSLFTVLDPTTATALGAELSEVAPASLCTVDGCKDQTASTATLRTYCVFGVCTENLPVKFPIWDAVGLSYLSRFRVDLDFPRKRFVYCD